MAADRAADPTALTAGDADAVRDMVRAGYSRIARGAGTPPVVPGTLLPTLSPAAGAPAPGTASQGGCCVVPADPDVLARALGYTAAELRELPAGTNLGLSCGNPAAIGALQPGETVLDLGSGAGFDILLASMKVGPRGRAIGVDMTPEMLSRARASVARWHAKTGLENVEVRLGEIEHLPVADCSVDVVISNCVLNLSPDKPQVWREIARVLKPGGRVAVSDLALFEPLPPAVVASVDALVGCVAGAALICDTERYARDAGLVDLRLEPRSDYLTTLEAMGDPLYAEIGRQLPAGRTVRDYVTTLLVTARRA